MRDKVINETLHKLIKHKAISLGCKETGDFVWFNKRCYYVNIREDIVTEQILGN